MSLWLSASKAGKAPAQRWSLSNSRAGRRSKELEDSCLLECVVHGGRVSTPRVPRPVALARGLLAGWWPVGGQGPGGSSDRPPENRLLPAGPALLRAGHQASP